MRGIISAMKYLASKRPDIYKHDIDGDYHRFYRRKIVLDTNQSQWEQCVGTDGKEMWENFAENL